MSGDTEAPAPQDTPTGETGNDVPWQKRYEDLRPEFDRTSQALKSEREIWDDEDALLERLSERYPDWLVGDESPEDSTPAEEPTTQESTPPRDPRLDEALPILEQLAAAEAERNYERDLSAMLNGREVNEHGREFIRAMTARGGDNQKALEGAVNKWFEAFPVEEKPAEKKRASHVIAAGKMTEDGKPDWSKMSDDEIDRYMSAEVIARSRDT